MIKNVRKGNSKEKIVSKDKQRTLDNFKKTDSFCSGLNFYKLFWIFIICSVLGYILEMIWCYIEHGHLESRNSLIYGPFSIIYGFGAVIMTCIIFVLKKQKTSTIFLVTTTVGASFEFFCSYIQEKLFGTVSWNYGNKPFCIQGRANLLFACFWGILGILFLKRILPMFNRFIEQIPNNSGIIITWIIIVFMAGNMFLSAAAVKRQTERRLGIDADNKFEFFLDEKFPDEVLKQIYANMRVVDK